MARVAATPDAMALLEVVDGCARHHIPARDASKVGAVLTPTTSVLPLLLGGQHLEAALRSILHDLRSTVAPMVGMAQVAATPDALALLEVGDGCARHHILAQTVQNGYFACVAELALAPLLLRHLLSSGVVPKRVLALGPQAGEDEAHGDKSSFRFPVHSALELRHDAFATFDPLDPEPLLGVDILDHTVFLTGESALRRARVALGVEVPGVAFVTLDVVEAVFVRAPAEAHRHRRSVRTRGGKLVNGYGPAMCEKL